MRNRFAQPPELIFRPSTGPKTRISRANSPTRLREEPFYEGAGIYRNVWLDKTAPVSIAPDGIFVQSKFENNIPQGSPEIAVEVRLLNTLTNPAEATVNCEIISPEGKSLKKLSNPERMPRLSQRVAKFGAKLSSPVLWSPESPKLYKLVTTVSLANKLVDQIG